MVPAVLGSGCSSLCSLGLRGPEAQPHPLSPVSPLSAEFPLEVPELTVTGQREEPLFLCNSSKVLLDEVRGGGNSAMSAAAAALICSRCPLEPLPCRQRKKQQRVHRGVGSTHPPP